MPRKKVRESPRRRGRSRGSGNRVIAGVICTLLAALVWVAFGQALHHEFLDYDDNVYVYDNSRVTDGLTLGGIEWAFTHVHANNWHPLTTLSHMLDCQLYGLHPWGHHLSNILLHAAAAILLFLALRQLTAQDRTGNIGPSAFVAALFAVHPLRVESVVWVAERKDVLSGVFFMLTLWAYARYARSDRSSPGRYTLALVLFALGLMCKPTLVTLPFVLLLLDYWPLRRSQSSEAKGQKSRRWLVLVAEKIPFFLLSAASSVATIVAQRQALTKIEDLPFTERVGNAVVSYLAYLGSMIYPAHLTVWYPYEPDSLSVSEVILAFVLLLIISAVFFFWRRRYPFLLVGWLWFVGMLVPMIGIVQVGQQPRADRYTYLPMIGLYLLLVWGADGLLSKGRRNPETLGATALLIIATLITLSHGQTRSWRNTEVLWEHAIESTSNNYMAHYNLGNVLMKKGRLDEAIAEFKETIAIKPSYPQAHHNLGYALATEGKFSEAIAATQAALRQRRDFVEAYNSLGYYLATVGKPDEALNQFREALRINPNYIQAHLNLADVLAELGRREEAEAHLAEAMRLQARDANARPQ